MNIDSEKHLRVLSDFSDFRFVRQCAAPFEHTPNARCLQDAIIVAYTTTLDQRPVRLFYVVSSPDDGLCRSPSKYSDPHGGLPILARSVNCASLPIPYVYAPREVLEREAKSRQSHIAYWQREAKLRAKKAAKAAKPKKPWWQLW